MTITSIREALRSLSQALQISSVFPAAFFVIIQVYFVLPGFFDFEQSSLQALSLSVSASLMISYLLYAFNFPLIRLLEGYKLQSLAPLSYLHQRRREEVRAVEAKITFMRELHKQLRNLLTYDPISPPSEEARNWSKEVRLNKLRFDRIVNEQQRATNFPSNPASVLPTRLGNVIAAWEEYSYTRYGMDAVALWPRLVPILKERDFLRFVDGEKTVFDFLLNLLFVVVLLGVESFYIFLYMLNPVLMVLTVIITLSVAYILYEAMLVAARQWGATVKVAFDLFRHDLHQRLGLKTKLTFAEDFKLWNEVSQYLNYPQANVPDTLFMSTTAVRASRTKAEINSGKT